MRYAEAVQKVAEQTKAYNPPQSGVGGLAGQTKCAEPVPEPREQTVGDYITERQHYLSDEYTNLCHLKTKAVKGGLWFTPVSLLRAINRVL